MKHILFLLTILQSCNQETRVKDYDIEFTLSYSQSYKYDLENGIYTVYFMSKEPTQIPFRLTSEEKSKLVNFYYDLDLDKIIGRVIIEDNCQTMPKLYTRLQIGSKLGSQSIQIDEECESYNVQSTARKLKRFLSQMRNILNEKPEIKNAPKSDIVYM